MNWKLLAYKFGKAALVGGGAALTASLSQGVPSSKAAIVALGGAVIAGAGHACISAIEQGLGYQTVQNKAPSPTP